MRRVVEASIETEVVVEIDRKEVTAERGTMKKIGIEKAIERIGEDLETDAAEVEVLMATKVESEVITISNSIT